GGRGARAGGDRAGDDFGSLHQIGGHEIDEILREPPDRRRVAEELVRVEVHAAVVAVAVVEVAVEHEHLRMLEVLQCPFAELRALVHQSPIARTKPSRSMLSFTKTTRPPTIVAATPPR